MLQNIAQRGQVSITVALIGAGAMVVTSFLTAYATTSTGVEEVRGEVRVIEERENNHYLELKQSNDRIEKKLDLLISTKAKQ